MEIVVDISDTEMDKIVERAKDEVREEITEEKLKDYLYNSNDINIIEILADFNVYKRCENLNDKKVGDLRSYEKIMLAMLWLRNI